MSELISALPVDGEAVDAASYISDVEGENVGMYTPASFFLPMHDADRDSPDAESGDTLPVAASSESSEPSTGTEECNVPLPVDCAVLSLTQARRYFEENTAEFDVAYVTQLTRMLNSLYERQARIAMRRNHDRVSGDRVDNQNAGN